MSATSATGILLCSTILPVLAGVTILLRFYHRSERRAQLMFEDWAQLPALILFIAMAVVSIYGVKRKAFGYPTPTSPITEPPESLILCEKLWFVLQIIQIPVMGLIKIAALMFYRRIFVIGRGVLNTIIWILILLVGAWMVAFIVSYLLMCGSFFQDAWGGWIGFAEHCLRSENYEEGYAISAFVLDTAILILPIPRIWRLQISTSRKIGISAVFLVAIIGYAASIARLAVFVQVATSNLANSHSLVDVQTADTLATWFSMLEIGLTLTALNMPAIWGLFKASRFESFGRSIQSKLQRRLLIGSGYPSRRSKETSSPSDSMRHFPAPQKGIEMITIAEVSHGLPRHTHYIDQIMVSRSVDIVSEV